MFYDSEQFIIVVLQNVRSNLFGLSVCVCVCTRVYVIDHTMHTHIVHVLHVHFLCTEHEIYFV